MKIRLLTPGPTPVPEDVSLAMAGPIIHHRSPVFLPVLQEVRDNLKYLFQTKGEVLIFASSGTGAMEGSVSNLFCAGDRVLVVRGGKFGERWAEICDAYGVEAINIDVPWGQAVDPGVIKKHLDGDPSIRAVLFQASETSTGVYHPVKEIADICNSREGVLTIVDAITALGVVNIPMDEWKLDVVVTGSQKALMLPPGLAFVALSPRAWEEVKKSTLPKYYFDFAKEKKNLDKNQTAYTPAVSLILGLQKSLRMIREETLEGVIKRHQKLADATRAGVQALGLELFAPDSPSNAVTAVKAPDGIDGQAIVKKLKDSYGITIAGGQAHAKGKIFRIAHIGYFDPFDIITAIGALEIVLNELGHKVEMGKGVKAAQKILFG